MLKREVGDDDFTDLMPWNVQLDFDYNGAHCLNARYIPIDFTPILGVF
ncbi:hypothetical protein [uncultured Pseudoalteromonas sp.]|nr:hypothetical protein [uncultured Pseudoalteromonas sp.]